MVLKITNKILWIVVIISALVSIILFLSVIFDEVYYHNLMNIDPELASKFGNFFGGFIGTMFAITSTLLILVTLITQYIENRKSQTGNNFFKMIDYHNENVKQLNVSHINPKKKEDKIEGRRAFVIFKLQISELFKVVKRIKSDLNLDISNEQIADIVYIAFYYGIDNDWKKFSENLFSKHEKGKEIVKKLLKAKESNQWYIGRTNQTSLSSYFRNMYNAIKLIDNDKYLKRKEKKEYVKILRAQLSNPELFVLFFNLLSRFGKKWRENKYIERYEFIKNIPLNYLGDYNPKKYFQMEYEEEELN